MLLIYSPESHWESISEKERGEIFQKYADFTDSIRKSGYCVAGDPLEATTAATTACVRNGKSVSTDGTPTCSPPHARNCCLGWAGGRRRWSRTDML